MLCHACYAEPLAMPTCTACGGDGRATRMPLCDDPWNEVVPGLWQGGHDTRSRPRSACVVEDQFDLVISLVNRSGYGPADGVQHHVLTMADAAVDVRLAAALDDLGRRAAAAIEAGGTVLTRCSGGLNRSALVSAYTLRHLGHDVDDAVALIRAARGPWALTNPMFVAHLRTLRVG